MVKFKKIEKEIFLRDLYTRRITEMKERMDTGSCPYCGSLDWRYRFLGSFNKEWECKKCGFILTKEDFYKKKTWKYIMEKIVRDERKRRKNSKYKWDGFKEERDALKKR